jgi:excisionase family DNA binding protein
MTDSSAPRWATIARAADYSSLAVRTIRQRIADGDLPAHKPRGSRIWLVDLNDVDDMIRDRRLIDEVRRLLATEGPQRPLTDEQVRLVARLLPPPRDGKADDDDAA